MTEQRFEMIITSADGSFHYLDKNTGEKITSTLELENKLNALHEENEQLKQFKDKIFDLLDKEITQNEEAIEWGEKQGADVGAMGFYTNMLKILRKELKE